MRHKKSNLDEMQEQTLLQIEKKCFWLLYFLILCEITGKRVMGMEEWAAAPETICFLAVSVFLVGSCLKNGIWDRRLKADWKMNLCVSLVGAAVSAVILLAILCRQFAFVRAVRYAAVAAALSFAVIFGILSVCSGIYLRRKRQIEAQEREDD